MKNSVEIMYRVLKQWFNLRLNDFAHSNAENQNETTVYYKVNVCKMF